MGTPTPDETAEVEGSAEVEGQPTEKQAAKAEEPTINTAEF